MTTDMMSFRDLVEKAICIHLAVCLVLSTVLSAEAPIFSKLKES